MNKFGLIIMDNMIEHLGIELLQSEWIHMSEALFRFAAHKNSDVRKSACHGIGSIAEVAGDNFKQISNDAVESIFNSMKINKKQNEDERVYYGARESCTIAFGKMIKNQNENLSKLNDVVKQWLYHLPIRFDKKEAKVQHEMLVDIIMESNANLVFGEQGENMP